MRVVDRIVDERFVRLQFTSGAPHHGMPEGAVSGHREQSIARVPGFLAERFIEPEACPRLQIDAEIELVAYVSQSNLALNRLARGIEEANGEVTLANLFDLAACFFHDRQAGGIDAVEEVRFVVLSAERLRDDSAAKDCAGGAEKLPACSGGR